MCNFILRLSLNLPSKLNSEHWRQLGSGQLPAGLRIREEGAKGRLCDATQGRADVSPGRAKSGYHGSAAEVHEPEPIPRLPKRSQLRSARVAGQETLQEISHHRPAKERKTSAEYGTSSCCSCLCLSLFLPLFLRLPGVVAAIQC